MNIKPPGSDNDKAKGRAPVKSVGLLGVASEAANVKVNKSGK